MNRSQIRKVTKSRTVPILTDIANYTQGRAPLINSLMGVALVLIGIPGYLYWKYKKKRAG